MVGVAYGKSNANVMMGAQCAPKPTALLWSYVVR